MVLHDTALYDEVAQRLNAVPLGEAEINKAIERLVCKGTLKKAGLRHLTLLYVRQKILEA